MMRFLSISNIKKAFDVLAIMSFLILLYTLNQQGFFKDFFGEEVTIKEESLEKNATGTVRVFSDVIAPSQKNSLEKQSHSFLSQA